MSTSDDEPMDGLGNAHYDFFDLDTELENVERSAIRVTRNHDSDTAFDGVQIPSTTSTPTASGVTTSSSTALIPSTAIISVPPTSASSSVSAPTSSSIVPIPSAAITSAPATAPSAATAPIPSAAITAPPAPTPATTSSTAPKLPSKKPSSTNTTSESLARKRQLDISAYFETEAEEDNRTEAEIEEELSSEFARIYDKKIKFCPYVKKNGLLCNKSAKKHDKYCSEHRRREHEQFGKEDLEQLAYDTQKQIEEIKLQARIAKQKQAMMNAVAQMKKKYRVY